MEDTLCITNKLTRQLLKKNILHLEKLVELETFENVQHVLKIVN